MKNFSFISYKKLRKTWMYQVLDLLSKQKLKHFRYLKQRFYNELVNGFYVYAKKKEKDNDDNNVDDCVNYITRYTSRPPMAENRIIKYEDDKKMIRW
ncbi:transposase [Faecalibacillus intestinalis]|uniref:transposase n=1 Tax=Faecalibacillus intestinalis TaxID=1982626 RepID=UPI0039928C54